MRGSFWLWQSRFQSSAQEVGMTPTFAALARLRGSLRRKAKARRALMELAACPAYEQHRIAADIGLCLSDLTPLSCTHCGPTELLPRRLHQLGLDPEFVGRASPALYRDLVQVCASCRAWRQCRNDLGHGNVQIGMDQYCLNSPMLDSLTVKGRRTAIAAKKGGQHAMANDSAGRKAGLPHARNDEST